jgi:hypothetical protein
LTTFTGPDLLPSNFWGISCDYRLPTSTTAKSAFTLETAGQRRNDPAGTPPKGQLIAVSVFVGNKGMLREAKQLNTEEFQHGRRHACPSDNSAGLALAGKAQSVAQAQARERAPAGRRLRHPVQGRPRL